MNTTITSHLGGEIISHDGQLVAIGGVTTATVEVLQNKIWNNNVIPIVGHSLPLSDFSTLSTKNGLYVFGELTFFGPLLVFNDNKLNSFLIFARNNYDIFCRNVSTTFYVVMLG